MIIFVTGQYAGAQYIHPLLKKWDAMGALAPEYTLVATGSSEQYWQENGTPYEKDIEKNDDVVLAYLKTKNPRFILLSASGAERLEYIFILQARKLGIKTANFIDTWTNYRARFNYDGTLVYPNLILSINKKCTEEMVEEGIPADIIQEIGQPYLEDACNAIPALGTQILLPLQPIKKAWGNQLGYDEATVLDIVIPVIEQVDQASQLNITSHPDNDTSLFKETGIKLKKGDGVNDIKNCHTVLGMFSAQMVLGYLWGRKVASVQPNFKEADLSPLSRWGLIPRIDNREDLFKFINSKLIDTISQRSMLLDEIHGSLDRLDKFLLKG